MVWLNYSKNLATLVSPAFSERIRDSCMEFFEYLHQMISTFSNSVLFAIRFEMLLVIQGKGLTQNLAPLTVEMNLYRAADSGKNICFAANSSISNFGHTKHAYLI